MTKVDQFFQSASWADVAMAMPCPTRKHTVIGDGWVYFSSIDLAFQAGAIPDDVEALVSEVLANALANGDYVKAGTAQVDLNVLDGLHYDP